MLALVGAIAASAPVSAEPPCRARLCFVEALAPFLRRLREARPSAPDPHPPDRRQPHRRRHDHARLAEPAAGALRQWRTRRAGGGAPLCRLSDLRRDRVAKRRLERQRDLRRPGGGDPARPFRLHPDRARPQARRLAITTDAPEQDFDRVVVCALAGPGMGSIALRMGGREIALEARTRRAADRPAGRWTARRRSPRPLRSPPRTARP